MKRIDNILEKARSAAGLIDCALCIAFIDQNADGAWTASATLWDGHKHSERVTCGTDYATQEDATAAIQTLAEQHPNPKGYTVIVDNIPHTASA